MEAWVLHDIGRICFEDVDMPQPMDDEVLVEVRAAGICGSDIPRIYQTGAHVHPLIPGHEFSGRVVRVGKNVDAGWLDERVGIFPLIPCGHCAACQKQRYELCRDYSYLGSRRDGGFAAYAVVPAWNLVALPDGVSYEEAAMLEPMAVAVHAMRRAMPRRTETAAVCGLGTIGLLLLMFLLAEEIEKDRILVIGNKDLQRQIVKRLGLPDGCYCDSRTADVGRWLEDRTGGHGTDVFFECVGRKETVAQAVSRTAVSGRVVLIGNPYSDMTLEKNIYWKILRNELTVTGTWNSSFRHAPDDDWHVALDRLADHRIRPAELVTHRFAAAELDQGLHIMRDKAQEYVKMMMCMDRPAP